ncbi:MAG: DUF1016 family protein [Euryarchaeota archaeon]|nr:DUF1016 family protein [Euryarchaeota archaeon]MBU4222165.1 DUF1016 family protein [Euryarchaeota archaeon]MBU4340883.1 DUF1016 family protein [Euryarchaeota archaeon]MCG2737902.1 PDDEXK nuclease domain-containing protein [Candidatus Methanoperedenaceae archaeon]
MSENDLKNSILNELEIFIQNIGPNFIFLSKQKQFIIDGKICNFDFIIYSRDMRCLVPIDLKFGDKHIDDIERMKLKLQLVDIYRMHDGDDTPLGIILFLKNHKRSVEIVRISKSQGWISKYLVDFPLQKLFIEFLKKVIQHSNEERDEILTAISLLNCLSSAMLDRLRCRHDFVCIHCCH